MARKRSIVAPDWWDYTTLDDELLRDAAKLSENDLLELSREGFQVIFYDTLESFYLAEALEYIETWKQATPSQPTGICGPIGPTEQLPLVAQLVNVLEVSLKNAHFWGMDEWVIDGMEVSERHPLSFARADRALCFDRIKPELRIPEANIHFPKVNRIYLTIIDEDFEGNTYFPEYKEEEWEEISYEEHERDAENPYDYSFLTLERKNG